MLFLVLICSCCLFPFILDANANRTRTAYWMRLRHHILMGHVLLKVVLFIWLTQKLMRHLNGNDCSFETGLDCWHVSSRWLDPTGNCFVTWSWDRRGRLPRWHAIVRNEGVDFVFLPSCGLSIDTKSRAVCRVCELMDNAVLWRRCYSCSHGGLDIRVLYIQTCWENMLCVKGNSSEPEKSSRKMSLPMGYVACQTVVWP